MIAALALENLLTVCRDGVKFVGVGRRLQRVKKKRQCVELLIEIARTRTRVRESLEVNSLRNKVAIPRQAFHILVERRVAHQVGDRPLLHQARVIKVFSVPKANKIGYLNRIEEVTATAGHHAGWYLSKRFDDFFQRQLAEARFRVWPHPRGVERRAEEPTHSVEQVIRVIRARYEFFQPIGCRPVKSKTSLRFRDMELWERTLSGDIPMDRLFEAGENTRFKSLRTKPDAGKAASRNPAGSLSFSLPAGQRAPDVSIQPRPFPPT